MIYYRLHNEPETFGPENAWSQPLQESELTCPVCHGRYKECEYERCRCGVVDYADICRDFPEVAKKYHRRGYSCVRQPETLLRYILVQGWYHIPLVHIVEFSGRRVGTGPDGEPLVVPNQRYIRWYTVAEFAQIYGNELNEKERSLLLYGSVWENPSR